MITTDTLMICIAIYVHAFIISAALKMYGRDR
jgi:hypothetical protein